MEVNGIIIWNIEYKVQTLNKGVWNMEYGIQTLNMNGGEGNQNIEL